MAVTQPSPKDHVEEEEEQQQMRSMEVSVGTWVNEDAQSAWEEASESCRGTLKRFGLSGGWVAASILLLFACGSLLLSSRAPTVGNDWKNLKAGFDQEIFETVSKSGEYLMPTRVVESANVYANPSFLLVLAAESSKRTTEQEQEDPLSEFPDEMIVREFESYVLVLNKFPVFEGHSLLVTKEFVPQSARLTRLDLDALHRCIYAADAIGFYNSHEISGSSQPHRHLQLVPLSSISRQIAEGEDGKLLPGIFAEIDKTPHEFWRWSSKTPFFPVVRKLSAYSHLAHGLVRLPDRATFDVDFGKKGGFADALLRSYVVLASHLGILGIDEDLPHNVLLYKDWILVVKRTQSRAAGVSVNGLAFAAILLVRDATTYNALLRAENAAHGNTTTPLSILAAVSAPAA